MQGDQGGGTCYGQSIGDGNKNVVVDLNGKTLNDSNGVKVDWGNSGLYKNSTHQTLNWTSGILYDPNNGNESLNWDVGYATDPGGSGCQIKWNNGTLWADSTHRTLNWNTQQMYGSWTINGTFFIHNGSIQIGNTLLTETKLQQLLELLNRH